MMARNKGDGIEEKSKGKEKQGQDEWTLNHGLGTTSSLVPQPVTLWVVASMEACMVEFEQRCHCFMTEPSGYKEDEKKTTRYF